MPVARRLAQRAAESARSIQYRMPGRTYGWIEAVRWLGSARKVEAVDPPSLGEAPLKAKHRVLIAPANYAGQGFRWASALNSHIPDVEARAWAYSADRAFSFPSHASLPLQTFGLPARWHRRNFEGVVERYTHVLFESGRTVFGPLFGFDVLREIRELQKRGVRVAMLWHGTDIRQPTVERAANPWSPFHDRDHRSLVRALEARAVRNQRVLHESEVPQFFSTPDLRDHVPHGTWLPVVVESEKWLALPPPPPSTALETLFIPSNPWIKGAQLLRPSLDALEAAGVIRLSASGRVKPEEVLALVRDSQIVLDQFRLHLYGVAAVEAMMAARPVVALAGPPLREVVRALAGVELPVVSATASDLASVLRRLAADGEEREKLGELGRAYATEWHDGKASARVLARWLEEKD